MPPSSCRLCTGLQPVEHLQGFGMPVVREREPCQQDLFDLLEVQRM